MWYKAITSSVKSRKRGEEIQIQECPYCGNSKYNCELNINKRIFHCWVCGAKGTANALARKLGIDLGKDVWHESVKVTPPKHKKTSHEPEKILSLDEVSYESFSTFLSSKGITREDIKTYQLRQFGAYLIVPLKEGNEVVYYSRRNMETGSYLNPEIEKKNLFPYYLGEKDKFTVYLCEGAFDAISIHKLGCSSAVLLGTNLTEGAVRKFKAFGFKKAVVCLDGDVIPKAIKVYDHLVFRGVETEICFFPEDEDPNDVYVKSPDRLLGILQGSRKPTIKDRLLPCK